MIDSWLNERQAWLHRKGIAVSVGYEYLEPGTLSPSDLAEYHQLFSSRWQQLLDRSEGTCPFLDDTNANLVGDTLRHFDGERYVLTDYVVMPNHVHLIASFPSTEMMLAQCRSWKQFTATRLNKRLIRTGRFWQSESFDHLIRSAEQFEYLRDYIADNPTKAGMDGKSAHHYSIDLRGSPGRRVVHRSLADQIVVDSLRESTNITTTSETNPHHHR